MGGCQANNITDSKGFTNDVKVTDFIKDTESKKGKKRKKNNLVKKCGGMFGGLGMLLMLVLAILMWLFGRYDGEQQLDDTTRDQVIDDIIGYITDGTGTEGWNIGVKTFVMDMLKPMCDGDYGSYNISKGMENPGSDLGFTAVFGILIALSCMGVEGAFRGLEIAFFENADFTLINDGYKDLIRRSDMIGPDTTIDGLRNNPGGTNIGWIEDLDGNLNAAQAVKKKWDDAIAKENEPYNLALIHAVVPFILNVRKANGIHSIRDISESKIAPLVKIYDSRLDFALMDLLARSPYDEKDRCGLYDETRKILDIFDKDMFKNGFLLTKGNQYMKALAELKTKQLTATPVAGPINSNTLTDELQILLVQNG